MIRKKVQNNVRSHMNNKIKLGDKRYEYKMDRRTK